MDRKLLALAAMAALAAPSAGMPSIVLRRGEDVPNLGWAPPKGRVKVPRKVRRDASRLQLRGWGAIPCDAPAGYHWHRAPMGRQLYYLLKKAPGERSVVYDEVFDRSIIRSGWGYVKPTYAHGDVR